MVTAISVPADLPLLPGANARKAAVPDVLATNSFASETFLPGLGVFGGRSASCSTSSSEARYLFKGPFSVASSRRTLRARAGLAHGPGGRKHPYPTSVEARRAAADSRACERSRPTSEMVSNNPGLAVFPVIATRAA